MGGRQACRGSWHLVPSLASGLVYRMGVLCGRRRIHGSLPFVLYGYLCYLGVQRHIRCDKEIVAAVDGIEADFLVSRLFDLA